MIHFTSRQIVSDLVQSCHQITLSHFKTYRINCHFYESFHFMTIHSTCVVFLVVTAAHTMVISVRPLDEWTFECPMDISVCPMDISVCPMDKWTFECPMDISVRPMDEWTFTYGHLNIRRCPFVHSSNGRMDIWMSNGHFCSSTGRMDI